MSVILSDVFHSVYFILYSYVEIHANDARKHCTKIMT